MEYRHKPVLLAEVLHYIRPRKYSIIVDCTLGGAGHAGAIALSFKQDGLLIGIDLDNEAIDAAHRVLDRFSQQIILMRGNFADIDQILSSLNLDQVDGFLLDLGVSSPQLDLASRGFSYQQNGPLDMRMDRGQKKTAADIVNGYSGERLVKIIQEYGEEKWAKRIAHFIVERRKKKPFSKTKELVQCIKDAIPASARRYGGHPARRTFQALRIELNQELENLKVFLKDGFPWLRPGGRMVIITYHSLEDRIVKKKFQEWAKGCICPSDFPECRCGQKPKVKILTKKPIRPKEEEIKENPRAKSAKLRAIEKLESK